MSAEARDAGALRSVSLACDVLDTFLEDEELGVTEVARRLDIAKSTAHKLMSTLVGRGLLAQNRTTGKYRLGVHLFELGELSVTRIELRRQSKTLLESLREASGMTVNLAVRAGVDTLFLERLSTLRSMSAYVQFRRRWPLHATASGKVICAFDPIAAGERLAAGLPKYARSTISTAREFRAVLDQVRRQGYATSRNEVMDDFASIAAPVFDHDRLARAAVSISGSVGDLEQNHNAYVRLLTTATQSLTRSMGGRA